MPTDRHPVLRPHLVRVGPRGVTQMERRMTRPLGMVLVRDGRTEQRHDAVAGEVVDEPRHDPPRHRGPNRGRARSFCAAEGRQLSSPTTARSDRAYVGLCRCGLVIYRAARCLGDEHGRSLPNCIQDDASPVPDPQPRLRFLLTRVSVATGVEVASAPS